VAPNPTTDWLPHLPTNSLADKACTHYDVANLAAHAVSDAEALLPCHELEALQGISGEVQQDLWWRKEGGVPLSREGGKQ